MERSLRPTPLRGDKAPLLGVAAAGQRNAHAGAGPGSPPVPLDVGAEIGGRVRISAYFRPAQPTAGRDVAGDVRRHRPRDDR